MKTYRAVVMIKAKDKFEGGIDLQKAKQNIAQAITYAEIEGVLGATTIEFTNGDGSYIEELIPKQVMLAAFCAADRDYGETAPIGKLFRELNRQGIRVSIHYAHIEAGGMTDRVMVDDVDFSRADAILKVMFK